MLTYIYGMLVVASGDFSIAIPTDVTEAKHHLEELLQCIKRGVSEFSSENTQDCSFDGHTSCVDFVCFGVPLLDYTLDDSRLLIPVTTELVKLLQDTIL